MNEAVWYMEDLPEPDTPVVCFGELRCKTQSESVFQVKEGIVVESRHFVACYAPYRGWSLRANFTPVDVVYAWSPFPGIEMRLPKEQPKTFAEVLTGMRPPVKDSEER